MEKKRVTPEERKTPIGRVGYLIINSTDSKESAKFWSAVTGRELGDVSPPYIDLASTNNEDGVTISIQQVPDQESLGMHIDIVVDNIAYIFYLIVKYDKYLIIYIFSHYSHNMIAVFFR